MNRLVRCSLLAALVGVGSLAQGAEQKPTFESLDKNSDGKVSLNEASVHDPLFVAFKNLDANKDGELNREEFARYQGGKSGA
jgi:Ca2+-binding EF-hand superfamily protein